MDTAGRIWEGDSVQLATAEVRLTPSQFSESKRIRAERASRVLGTADIEQMTQANIETSMAVTLTVVASSCTQLLGSGITR